MKLVLALLIVAGSAAADPHVWSDDTTTVRALGTMPGGTLQIEKREMPYGSGYRFVEQTAVWIGQDGRSLRTVLASGPTNCSDVQWAAPAIVVETCVQRFGDLMASTTWTLDARTGRLRAGMTTYRSPYLDEAQRIVVLLRARRFDEARTALDRLGASPDGQESIEWWWEAHWLIAEGIGNRPRLRTRVARLLEIPGGVELLLSHGDLAIVPRVSLSTGDDSVDLGAARVSRRRAPAIGPLLDRAVSVLRGGTNHDRQLANRLARAVRDARAATP
jgi:hypothetical protein